MIIEGKLQTWSQKALAGEKGYELLYHRNGEPICVSERYEEAVLAYRIIVWEDDKTVFNAVWEKEQNKAFEKDIALVIKKQKKLLLYDGESKVYGIGEGAKDSLKIMAFYKFQYSGTLIIAVGEIPEIRILSYVRSKKQDAVHLLSSLIGDQFPVGNLAEVDQMDSTVLSKEVTE